MAGEQLGASVVADDGDDLLHDLAAVALALVPDVDEQLPEEPRAVDVGGEGTTSQLSITKPIGTSSAFPLVISRWLSLGAR